MINYAQISKKEYIYITFLFVFTVGFIICGNLGYSMYGLRELLSFSFFSIIPGYLLLYVLNIKIENRINVLLFSVGMSIFYIMAVGLTINLVLPICSYPTPFSFWPLIVSFSVSTFILIAVTGVLLARRTACSSEYRSTEINKKSSLCIHRYLLPLLLFFVFILGSFLVRYYNNNYLLLLGLIFFCGLIFFYAFTNNSYKLLFYVIIVCTVSLLLSHTLYSSYLTGYDINTEHLFLHYVIENGFWDYTHSHTYNTAVSVVLLGPIYSILTSNDSISVLKIAYPVLYTLVPASLFVVYSKVFNFRKAFLSVILFISIPVFFIIMPALARQEIAEIFFALIILLIFNDEMNKLSKKILMLIFGFCIIISHYSFGYVALGYLFISILVYKILSTKRIKLSTKIKIDDNDIKMGYISFYIVCLLTWYMFIGSGEPFYKIVNIGHDIIIHLKDMFAYSSQEQLVGTAVGLDFTSVSILGKCYRIIQYLVELFIVVGFVTYFISVLKGKGNVKFFSFSLGSALILFACIVIPNFSSYLNMTRFFHIALFFLAPMFVEGIYFAIKLATSIMNKKIIDKNLAFKNVSQVFTVTLLLIYFIFNSGFVFESFKLEKHGRADIPFAHNLSGYRIDLPVFSTKEYLASIWVENFMPAQRTILADEYRRLLLRKTVRKAFSFAHYKKIKKNQYLFLGDQNINNNKAVITKNKSLNVIDINTLSVSKNNNYSYDLIFSNGGSKIFKISSDTRLYNENYIQ